MPKKILIDNVFQHRVTHDCETTTRNSRTAMLAVTSA